MHSNKLKRLPNERPVEWLARVTKDEEFMAQASQDAVDKNLAKGIPVHLADDKGIYQLLKDGSKIYVELFN